jgi:branched-chain amino acid transport system ATP-binding protein
MRSPEPVLDIRQLRKSFGGLRAVDGCTFTVQAGRITALIGPNGAGKTTVFHLISGLLHPDDGEIWFRGHRIDGLPPHAIARLGLTRTFQIPRELQRLTVLENLLLYAKNHPGERLTGALFGRRRFRAVEEALVRRAEEILDLVDLRHLADEYAGHLSGGQKKLLELARALMAHPELVLLDEPGAGVNPTLMKRLVEVIQQANRRGQTFLVIEHDMDLVMTLSHHVIVMSQGRRLTEGPFEEIRRNEEVLEHYFGQVHAK